MAARTRYRTSSRTRSISRRASLGTLYPHRLAFECLEDRRLLSCTVGDWVWKDANNNGIQDTGEPGVAGAAVELFNAAGVSQKTTITDANGLYSFSDLTAGASYYLVFHAPVGYSFALQDQGSDNADSDVAPSGSQAGYTGLFALGTDENRTNVDAGLTGTAPGFGYALGIGAGSDDVGRAVATDASGNVYVTGAFQGTVDFDSGLGNVNLPSAGGNDIFVAKYSPAGALIWARRMGGTSGDYGYGIAVAADGSVYTTGYFQSTADFDPGTGTTNLTSAGSQDIFVSKLNSDGNFVWARKMGGSSTDSGYAIAVANDGSVYTTGYFGGTTGASASFGTTNLTSAGAQDGFVSKLGSDGTFLWARRMGGGDADYGFGIAVATDGNLYTTGSFGGTSGGPADFGTTTLTSAGLNDAFVSKLDAAGNFVWAGRMGGSASDNGYGIAVATDGAVYTTGSFRSLGADFGTTHLDTAGAEDVFVSKLDTSGSFLWTRQMRGADSDVGRGIAVAPNGCVYTTGHFGGTSGATADFDPGTPTANLTSAGTQDVFVSKLNSAGSFVWARHMGGSTSDYGYALALAADGSIYTTGLFSGTAADFDPGTGTFNLTSAGGNDGFVAKLTDDQSPARLLHWVGGTTGYWTDPSNWSDGVLPTWADDVTIDPASPTTVIIRPGETAAADSLTVGAGHALSMPADDPSLPTANLLTNSTFESPVVAGGSMTTKAANWISWGAPYLRTQCAHTGGQSLMASAPASGVRQNNIAATPGTAYTISAYAMVPAATPLTGDGYATLDIYFYDSGGGQLSHTVDRILDALSATGGPLSGSLGSEGWNHFYTTAVAPSGTSTCQASIAVHSGSGTATGAVYYDDVTFGPAAPGPSALTATSSLSNSGTITVGPANTIIARRTFTQSSTGTLDIQLGGTAPTESFGSLAVDDTATLAGTLKSQIVFHDYLDLVSTTDVFTPITFTSASGTFANYDLPGGTGYQFAGSVTFTNVVLSTVPTTPVVATINVADALHPVLTNLLGTDLSSKDYAAVTAQTEEMIEAAGVQLIRLQTGEQLHFNVNYTALDPAQSNYPALLQGIADMGATGMWVLPYGNASPQEDAAQLAYTLGSSSDNTVIGNGIQWNDTTGQWERADWGTVGYWASLRAAVALAQDDGLNFLRISHPAPFANVKYWEIGNEQYRLSAVDHHGTNLPDGTTTGAAHDPGTYMAFAAQVANYADGITAAAGLPPALVGINGGGSPTGGTNGGEWVANWIQNLAAAGLAGGFIPDFISDHNYMQTEGMDDAKLLNGSASDPTSARNWSKHYAQYQASLQAAGLTAAQAAGVQLQGNEWNCAAGTNASYGKQSTNLVNGLFVADSIGSLLLSDYQGDCFWVVRTGMPDRPWNYGPFDKSYYGWREGGTLALLGDANFGNDPPDTAPYVAFPTYYGLQLASKFAQSGGEVVSAASNYTDLHVYAVQQASGHLSLLVINTNPAADLTTQFDLTGFQPSGDVQVWQYGKAEDTAQSLTTDGVSALTNFSTTLSLSGSNFSYLFPAYSMTVLDLGRAVVTITANNADKTYGSADPMFSVSYVGFAPGDGPSNLGGTLAFTTNEPPTGYAPVGSYSITPSGLTSSNYAINFVPGTLSVTPAALTVTASAPASGPEGTAITVSGTATDPTDPEAVPSFAWSVTRNGGPYVTGSGASFTFTPDDQGTYLATLVATDIHLSSGSVVKTISVTDVPPTASVGGPTTGPEGTAITLTGSASEPSSADAATLTYTWNVSNNGSFYIHGSGPNFTFAPNDQGTYVATLTASDKDGSATATQTISVTDVAPTAAIGGPATGPEGTPITLIGSVTEPSSADAATLSYAWNVNKNGSFYVHGSGPNFTFTPNDEGTYVATLTASDKDGSGTATRTISVTDVLPTASISGPASGNEGTPITLTGSASDPSTVDAAWGFTYTWNVTRNGNFYVRASGPNLAFTPNDQGNYLATLTALETNGTSGVATKTIGVIDVLPTAAIGGPTTDTEGTAITLTGSATDPSTVDMAASFSYRWNVTKDSNAYSMGSGGSFAFTPNDQGTYVATLIATGRDGSSPAATRTITVRNVAPNATVGKVSNVSEGTPITLTGSAIDPSSADTATGLTYDWRVNKDGNFYIQGNGTSFTFTPTDQGSYLATLTATDKDHGSGTATRTVIVSNVAPTVTLSGPTTGYEGSPVTLASTVTDPSSDDATRGFGYSWSVSRNGVFYIRGSGSESFNFTPNDQGTYVATLTATDKDNGSRAGTLTIVVGSVAPAVTLSKPGAVNEGTAITLGGTVIDPSAADSAWGFTYAWNVTKNGAAYASGNDTSPAFTPDDNGTYTATLTATDKDGVSGTSSKTLTVGNVPPSVTINKPGTAAEGAPLTLSAVVIDPSSADTAIGFGYDWNVTKNGSFYRHGTDASLTLTPDDSGSYVATLIATDKDGYPGTATRTFTVMNVAPTASLGNNGPVAVGSTALVSFSAVSDPSSIDTTAGLRYAYDFDNNGTFEVGNGAYAGSLTVPSATVPTSYLATPGTRVVHARIIDKDDGHTDYTTSITVGSPLLAKDVGTGGSANIVGQAAAQSLLVAAVARWSATGADVSLLRNTHLRIADLPGATLGLASPADHTIWLDVNAAGHGWFIDLTPLLDEEFARQAAGDWLAQDARAAQGMDLLTVISHELGHLLGRADLDPDANAGKLMDATLGEGIRRLAAASTAKDCSLAAAGLRGEQLQALDDFFAMSQEGSDWTEGLVGIGHKRFQR